MTKKMCSNFLVSSICYIALGIALMMWPEKSLDLFCYLVGGVTVAYGLYRIYRFISHREERFVTVGLFIGIIALALGICLFIKPDVFSSILPFILGLYLVFDGVVKLQAAFEIKKDGYPKWGILLMLATLMVVLGVIIIFNPFTTATTLVAFVGACMLVDGIINIWNAIVVRQQIRAVKDAVEDVADAVADAVEGAAKEVVAQTDGTDVTAEAPEAPAPADGSDTPKE